MNIEKLAQSVASTLGEKMVTSSLYLGELTIEVAAADLIAVAKTLRDDDALRFEELIDLCGVDYSTYGVADWQTHSATNSGFERGVSAAAETGSQWTKPRFASVIHLLSIAHNQRIRVRVFAEDSEFPVVPSLVSVWAVTDWYEREAFDLFGIMYEGHPDLRRILTDYGFVGHAFRKDFPLIGNVEMRYDANKRRCVYEEVSIEPRILVPRVIRDDARTSTHVAAEEGDNA